MVRMTRKAISLASTKELLLFLDEPHTCKTLERPSEDNQCLACMAYVELCARD